MSPFHRQVWLRDVIVTLHRQTNIHFQQRSYSSSDRY